MPKELEFESFCCICERGYISKGRKENTQSPATAEGFTIKRKWICGFCRRELEQFLCEYR